MERWKVKGEMGAGRATESRPGALFQAAGKFRSVLIVWHCSEHDIYDGSSDLVLGLNIFHFWLINYAHQATVERRLKGYPCSPSARLSHRN